MDKNIMEAIDYRNMALARVEDSEEYKMVINQIQWAAQQGFFKVRLNYKISSNIKTTLKQHGFDVNAQECSTYIWW